MTVFFVVVLCLAFCFSVGAEPVPTEGPARAGVTLYVSKLGDDSDGSSWARAFHTIQKALNAVPTESGGHRVVVRPDTYFEANLFAIHKGAQGTYNELVGDIDGTLGSGTSGWVFIDSGDPGQRGFKSYDWWGPIRAYKHGWSAKHTGPAFSAIGWDRWVFRNLYMTGGDGGLFFDLVDEVQPFTVVVENCVGIGRAFGGGVAGCLSRRAEPITFRRSWLGALDHWGDTAAAYVRVENEQMPEQPDAVFEDCTLVSPQCSLKAGNFGFHTFTRVKLDRCRLVTLNFSQPGGTPSEGIIQSVQEGKLLHVDLDDCTLMGYKVFGVMVDKDTADDISFTTRGDVRAYVQFQQPVPKGFHRMGHWPVDVFQRIAPPARDRPSPFAGKRLVKHHLCELSPFVWNGRLCHLECIRPGQGGSESEYYLLLRDVDSGNELARFAEGHGLASVIVHDGTLYAFASRWRNGGWHDVTMFKSHDLRHWESRVAVRGENEQVFNTSVCAGADGFVLVYESNDRTYPAFTLKFARSQDLEHWTKVPGALFGVDRYAACPCIRYANGYYYLLYAEHRSPRWVFETYVARSPDLCRWEWSSGNPVLAAEGEGEGICASDPELIEWRGRTLVYYCVSDQHTWANVKCAIYPGSLVRFLEYWFRNPAVPVVPRVSAR